MLGAVSLMLGAACLVLGVASLVLGAASLVLGAASLVLGAACLLLGAASLVLHWIALSTPHYTARLLNYILHLPKQKRRKLFYTTISNIAADSPFL